MPHGFSPCHNPREGIDSVVKAATNRFKLELEGVVIKGKGHWMMEEAPSPVIPQLVRSSTSRQKLCLKSLRAEDLGFAL